MLHEECEARLLQADGKGRMLQEEGEAILLQADGRRTAVEERGARCGVAACTNECE